jgi:predicted HicB family RNase H-like nuclease
MAGGRADDAQYAERVNAAADVIAAAATLAARFGVSTRQARRYVDQASAAGRREVPQDSVVFTVRLPASLAARVRARARASGLTISALVAEALTEFLSRGRGRGTRG